MASKHQTFDRALPSLTVALDPGAMAGQLGTLLQETGAVRVVGIELLKHKPARRCALAYTIETAAGRRRLFAKIFKNDRGAAILEQLRELSKALDNGVVSVPRPLGYVSELRMLVTEFVDGLPLATELYAGRSDIAARRMSAALARLHGCGVASLAPWGPRDELENTARSIDHLDPSARGPAAAALESLHELPAARSQPEQLPIHRDFYPDQVLDASGTTVLIDLDDARTGDPALDLGNFLAHLTLRALQFPEVARGCERARGAFLSAYSRDRNDDLTERIAFYEKASLLRLSGVYAARERWSETVPAALLRFVGVLPQTKRG